MNSQTSRKTNESLAAQNAAESEENTSGMKRNQNT